MLPVSVNGRPVATQPTASLLSRSTILILSATLIGIGLGQPLSSPLYGQSLGGGMLGIVSYIGLAVSARQRHREAIRKAFERATWNLNQRLDKFVADGGNLPAAPHHRGVPNVAYSFLDAD
ncbi:MAG: hypothetical protein HZA46_21210 [Planctomycetales bacterium]|nr:hypothetical protein [Planctomycetales bacterium]